MATVLPPARNNFFLEQVDYQSALSEALFIRIGQQNNFNNQRFYIDKPFYVNGLITGLDGREGLDGFQFVPFDAEIFEVFVFQRVTGAGTTEFDVKVSNDNGSTWNSIFATRPSIAATAPNNIFFKIGDTSPNFTAPVLAGTITSEIDGSTVRNIDANSALRLDCISTQDNAQDFGLVIDIRSR